MKTEYTITQAWGQDGDEHTNAVDIKLGVTNNWTDDERMKSLKVGDLLKIVDDEVGESFWTLIKELPDDHTNPGCYTCTVDNHTKMSKAKVDMSIHVPIEAVINPMRGSSNS